MLPRRALRVGGLLVLMLVAGVPRAAGAAPKAHERWLVIVHPVSEAGGAHSGILEELRGALLAEVDKYPELTVQRPPDLPSEDEALRAALRARRMKALDLVLTIVKVTRDLGPPEPGKPFRTLHRGIRLSITGTTLPEWLVALTGDGDAEVGADVGPRDDLEREGKAVLVDAGKAAVSQALERVVTKLRRGPPAGPKKAVAKKK
jgi:hypothetical protein